MKHIITAALVIAAASMLSSPGISKDAPLKSQVIVADKDHASRHHGRSKGSYSVVQSGNKVIINVDMETSRQGYTGSSRGYMVFALLDGNNKVVWHAKHSQTVGGRAPNGKNRKRDHWSYIVFGPPARAIEKGGGSVAFDISLTTSDPWGDPKSFLKSLKKRIGDVNGVVGALTPGERKAVGGWVIKKFGAAAM